VQSYTAKCVPYNYLDLHSNFGTFPSFEALYAACAAQCDSEAGCKQIWVAHDCDGGETVSWCMTGTQDTGSSVDKGWNANEIQCSYPPIPACGEWYNLAVP
jgi:hypothetical protein